MPSQYFSQNMAVMEKIFPLLAGEISKAKDGSELKIETASSGAATLLLGGVYIHSKRDPEREAERLVEAGGTSGGESPALVLGFGLGYSALALTKKFPDRPIIIVEKRVDILKKALEIRDLRPFLSRRQLVFVLDSEGVTGALALFRSNPGVPPLVLWNRALTSLDEEWYATAEDKIRTWNSRTNVNRATTRRF